MFKKMYINKYVFIYIDTHTYTFTHTTTTHGALSTTQDM